MQVNFNSEKEKMIKILLKFWLKIKILNEKFLNADRFF